MEGAKVWREFRGLGNDDEDSKEESNRGPKKDLRDAHAWKHKGENANVAHLASSETDHTIFFQRIQILHAEDHDTTLRELQRIL
jgi:hypothetical protein